MPTRKATTEPVEEPQPVVVNINIVPYTYADVRIIGTAPLLCDRRPFMGEDYKAPKYTELQKFHASLYPIPNGKPIPLYGEFVIDDMVFGFPAEAIKSACVKAARFIPGLAMTVTRGLFFIEEGSGLFEIKHPYNGKANPVIYRDMAEKRDGKAIPVVRARFDEWALDFKIKWQAHLTNQNVILSILTVAGENIGLGSQRPERSGRQAFGTFVVANEEK